MNKKAFQAVLSNRESDRESFSIGDCYVTQYEIQVPGFISFKKLLKEAWKIALSIFKMAVKLVMKSTLEAEKTARVHRLFGASKYINTVQTKRRNVREIQASLNGKTARYPAQREPDIMDI